MTLALPTTRRLPNAVAFYLLASIVVSFLAASSAPTPLYAIYQAEWGFSPITTTVVFGIYALAVLVSLLVFGSLSDHVGRRPVLLVAIAVQALTTVLFANADGVPGLILARIIQGVATGAAVGAIGAGMLDLDKAKGAIANSVSAPIGTAVGAFASGLLVQYLPFRTHLVYFVLLGVFALQGIGVALMRETSSARPGALASLRVQLALPRRVRRPFLLAAPALVAAWSLAGLYGALGPAIVHLLVGHNSFVLGGLALSAAAGSGALAVLALRNAAPRTVMRYASASLFVGMGITVLGINATSTVWFFIGTVIAGTGFGSGFQGAVRSVVPLALPHERSGVLSLVYVVSYLAMGVPAVIAGFLVVHGGGLLDTSREYGVAVMVLALLALIGALRPSRDVAPEVVMVEVESERLRLMQLAEAR